MIGLQALDSKSWLRAGRTRPSAYIEVQEDRYAEDEAFGKIRDKQP